MYPVAGTGVINLLEGRGRSMIDLVANHLNATVGGGDFLRMNGQLRWRLEAAIAHRVTSERL